jgi:hypothetical protein
MARDLTFNPDVKELEQLPHQTSPATRKFEREKAGSIQVIR